MAGPEPSIPGSFDWRVFMAPTEGPSSMLSPKNAESNNSELSIERAASVRELARGWRLCGW